MLVRLTCAAAVAASLMLASGATAQEPAGPPLPVQPPVETPVLPPPIAEPPPGEPPGATVITDDEAAFAEGEEPARPAPGAPSPSGPAVAGAQASAPTSSAPARGGGAGGQLPFTGPNAGGLVLIGLALCALGLGLRRWIAARDGIFMA